ncbi:MAG: 50S ribosomal protein L18 [Thermodesulfovibrionales bacterium]|nr:50S ribosomal protein L18 [Thermodesulfovibrionales bacterium]
MNKVAREKRHKRIRKKISGSQDIPRLSVYRSLNQIYVQLIDDAEGRTVLSASSLDKELKEHPGHRGNMKAAAAVGELIARRAVEKGIKKVVFDRSGYLYHGRIKTLADAARGAGLEF